jgi:hypothetical protein
MGYPVAMIHRGLCKLNVHMWATNGAGTGCFCIACRRLRKNRRWPPIIHVRWP